ncbi:VCBS domain-containing protein [Pseudotabrizicola formosa]|uniref:VCBS domain-containing protein n=1 Tax=Pseudotabrizicola formosa TaxID=2030009 RepID=UPI000CD05DC2|nr:VCBS domain-containing protein [Pseudotabrizicola formosa]
MNPTITLKATGDASRYEEALQVVLDRPSVVTLQLDPAQVQAFRRSGSDLVLILKDGTTFTIKDFYVVDAEGERNDLVLVDGDGVVWWAQYSGPDAMFELAEIERGVAPIASGFFGGGPLLAALAGGAAVLGGLGGDSRPALEPDSAEVQEAGVEPGGNDAFAGVASAVGDVLANDRGNGTTLEITGVALDGAVAAPGTALAGTYGSLVLQADGTWAYTLDNALAATQALAVGQQGTEVFTYTVSDGRGGTISSTLTIVVTGTNDLPVVETSLSDLSGAVTEAGGLNNGTPGVPEVAGQLVSTDPDTGATAVWTIEGESDARYGSFTLTPEGEWRFVLDNDLSATQSLAEGEEVTLTYPVRVTDEHGAYTSVVVTITVTGAADTVVIVGATTGTVSEAGGVDNASPGTATAAGQLVVDDPDDGTTAFEMPTNLEGTFGTFSFDPMTGNWGYTLDNSRAATQALVEGQIATDVLTVESLDGAATQQITVTVTGTNDVPVVSDGSGSVTEDVAVAGGDLVTGGTLTITDADAGESLFDPASLTFTGGSHGGAALGVVVVDANGLWTYRVDNSLAEVQTLNSGESLTETWTVASADGTATSTITVTINGTNDVPVVSNGTGSVTEDVAVADGDLVASGTLTITDTDDGQSTFDPDSVTFDGVGTPLGTIVVDANGVWSYRVDNSLPEVQSLGAGQSRTETWTVLSADGSATSTITVTVNGTNDQPQPQPDRALISTGQTAVTNVVSNDSDIDAGQTALLQVTTVDGQPIAPGGSITLSDGRGTVSLDGRGGLSFTPGSGVLGEIVLPYVITDGSGTGTATATADWVINVVGVDILDDASPDNATVGDNVLAQIDDLTQVVINGQAPLGGGVTGLIISGTSGEPVVVPPGSVTTGPDGEFTLTADLTGLPDGLLTVTMTAEDGAGNVVTTTDTILKDTVTTVEIDPMLVVNGEVPTITGTAEVGATLTVTIGSNDPVTLVVGPTGLWSVTPATPLPEGDVTVSVSAEDPYGNTDSALRTLSGLELADNEPIEPEHVTVFESGLSGGSAPGTQPTVANSAFTLEANLSGLDRIVIGGAVTGGTITGGTSILAADLLAASSGAPVMAPTAYGTMVITGYNPVTGVVSYSYTLTAAQSHASADGNNLLRESIQIAVIETDGDTRIDTLVAAVVDDVPLTPPAPSDLILAESASVNRPAATGLLADAFLGADGGQVHQIIYTDRAGVTQTSTLTTGGTVTVETQSGTLQVFADGAWTYAALATVSHVQPDNDTELQDNFSFTVIDRDGDISAQVEQQIIVTDTVPAIGTPAPATVDEANLPLGSGPNPGALTVSGSLNLTPGADSFDTSLSDAIGLPDGVTELTSGGLPVSTSWNAATRTLTGTVSDGSSTETVFTLALTNATEANAGYVFTLARPIDHSGTGEMVLNFGVTVTDSDGDSDTDSILITVQDDVPTASFARTIPEDGSTTFNTSADATPDNTTIAEATSTLPNPAGGMDYIIPHGVVTVNVDGTITYTPAANFSGTDTFTYTTNDGGTASTTTVTMTVTPVADAPGFTRDADRVATLEDTAVALGLNVPAIVDLATSPGNNAASERLGVITLTGIPAGTVVSIPGGDPATYTVVSGTPVTILLTDQPSVSWATGILSMTAAQFETLTLTPPPHSSANFTVNASVTSYEVDADGAQLSGVAGATTSTSVQVVVQAVTDDVQLSYNATGALIDTQERPVSIVYDATGGVGGRPLASATLSEDGRFNLSSLLSASFLDTDGSEVRSLLITNSGPQSIVVGNTEVGPGTSLLIPAPGLSTSVSGFPEILIGGTAHFSGDLTGISVTMIAQDWDADGYLNSGLLVPGNALGVSEADTTNNSVYLDLYVLPVANDVAVANVTTAEDTSVNFLAGVTLVDTSTGSGGQEVITEVRFLVPDMWTVTAPAADASVFVTSVDGATGAYVITFTSGTQAEREAVLDGFTILPPAHSSADSTLNLTITTQDTATVAGVTEVATSTADYPLTITVTPVAEQIGADSDGNAQPDLTMMPSHAYVTPGAEDSWFTLGTEGLFRMTDGWANEDADGSEATCARLTPQLISGDGSDASAIGSRFQWVDGGVTQTVTFTGTAIDVPVGALDTLRFMAAPDFSGEFRINVQAYTVDTDPDSGAEVSAVGGSAVLSNLLILPVADDVTLTINARVFGTEDTSIPLSIRPSSTDPSELFTVTIDRIPAGAVLTYNGVPQTIVPDPDLAGFGRVVIEAFDSNLPTSITPPLNSNLDFSLRVSAESVDTTLINGVSYSSTSETKSLTLDVSVKGAADPVSITPFAATYDEAALDAGSRSVLLSDLFSVTMLDADGSETLTMRVTGLPEGFALAGGTLLNPLETGDARVWVMNAAQMSIASVTVPPNYSGTTTFNVVPVTTENDGNSLTGAAQPVSFSVTPSPEATVAITTVVVEDVLTSLGFGIVHQGNGGALDTDETVAAVRISVSDTVAEGYSLYLGDPAQLLSEFGLTIVTEGGVDYYALSPAEAATLMVQAAPHRDGPLGTLPIQYQITDPGDGSVAPVTSEWQVRDFALTATPVTDQPNLALDGATGTSEGFDFTLDAVTVAGPGLVTLTTTLSSPDADGSEKAIRVIVEGVPSGVSLVDGAAIGPNTWLIVLEGTAALPITGAGGISLPLTFEIGQNAGNLTAVPITITVQVQDRGDEPAAATAVRSDSVTWQLTSTFAGTGDADPAVIDLWAFRDPAAQEDSGFLLADMVTAQVTAQTSQPNILTVMITDLPAGTGISGMVRTVINGVESWTASVTTAPGDTPEQVQAKLVTLLESISITPPANSNVNNTAGFTFDVRLTTAVQGGNVYESAEIANPPIAVEPVTDPAPIAIVLGAADSDGRLTESDTMVPFTITVGTGADGAWASTVDGQLYLTIDASPLDMAGGTLTGPDGTYLLQSVTGVAGVPNGLYYVVPGVTIGAPIDLTYTPPGALIEGSLSVNAWVQNLETGAAAPVTSTGSVVLPVQISNDGVVVNSPAVTGQEAPDATNASLVQLTGLSVALVDADGSETIRSILLSDLPEGFIVFTGTSPTDASLASLASNAGGTGGTNTWVLAADGAPLPAYVAILPPVNWSGTLPGGDGAGNGLTLIVTSGETALPTPQVQAIPLGSVTITPVANGLTLDTTNAFGTEGTIISLNLNASMVDAQDVSVAGAPDASQETVTLEIAGLGQYAAFYNGSTLRTNGVSYDGDSDTYTLTGLSQAELDNLGFVQAIAAITDGPVQVRAWTVDGSDVSAPVDGVLVLNLTAQLGTTGANRLIWTGELINAGAGEDTIHIRYGENLTGAALASNLRNIEVLDLLVAGSNSIADLTPDQVKQMIGTGSSLIIRGTDEDLVTLSGDWTNIGGGAYTGLLAGGSTVTLTLEGGVVSETSPMMVAGMMSFAAFDDASDSFGLASLDDQPEADAEPAATQDPVTEAELFTTTTTDLAMLLPEEEEAGPSGGLADDGGWESTTSGTLLSQTLEDDLLQHA